MQKIFSIILVALLVLAVNLTFGQAIKVSQVSFPTTADVGPQCSGGQIHDDGVAENGYGWNASAGNPSGWGSKFIPTVYPYKFTKFCVALTRLSTGVANFTFTITMWKSVNGMPTAPFNTVFMDTVTVTAAALPVWPAVSFYDFPLPSTWAPVTGTDSVFIGIKYNPVTMTGVYVASDESTTTTLWPGYCTVAAGPWTTIQSNANFAAYRSLLFRAEGGSVASQTFYASQWCANGTLPNMPAASMYSAATWLNDTLYVQAPDAAGTATSTVYRYVYGGTWSTGVPLPVTKAGGTLTTCGSKMYYIGGSSVVTTGSTDIYEYTPTTGAWVLKAPMPAALSGHGAVNWGDSVIFVISGNWATPSTSCYAYNVATNTWITTSAAPFARRSHATGISGNKIFMVGGYNAGYKKEFAIGTIGANSSTITWTTGPSIPVGYNGISRLGGAAYGDKFYAVGGEREVGLYSDSTWIWNIHSNMWTGLAGKPNAVSNMFQSVAIKKINDTVKVFCAGGYNGTTGLANLDVIGCGPTLTGIIGNIGTPLNYELSQNYPNPFNPVTKINYALPKSGIVTLKIYDVLGREVMTLVNEMKSAGNYSIDFNGANLSSGIYFYTLKSGDFTSVKKMTLIK